MDDTYYRLTIQTTKNGHGTLDIFATTQEVADRLFTLLSRFQGQSLMNLSDDERKLFDGTPSFSARTTVYGIISYDQIEVLSLDVVENLLGSRS